MEMSLDTHDQVTIEAESGLYIVQYLPGRMEGWGVGAINATPNLAESQEGTFLRSVVNSIGSVEDGELAFSDCTDSRFREKLDNGEPVPNREKLVGADIMMAFHMAEALGARFYQDPNAPLKVRLGEVIDFLLSNRLQPSTHVGCGAAKFYVPVTENAVKFMQVPGYLERRKLLLPTDVRDDGLHQTIVDGYSKRLSSNAYEGWSDDLVIDTIREKVGPRAVMHVRDDDRGEHGHVEAMIVRLDKDIVGKAVDVNKLAYLTDGGQAFTTNDGRMARIAELFGRGHDTDYRIAYMAGEDLTDAGHGTLATNLRTVLVKAA